MVLTEKIALITWDKSSQGSSAFPTRLQGQAGLKMLRLLGNCGIQPEKSSLLLQFPRQGTGSPSPRTHVPGGKGSPISSQGRFQCLYPEHPSRRFLASSGLCVLSFFLARFSHHAHVCDATCQGPSSALAHRSMFPSLKGSFATASALQPVGRATPDAQHECASVGAKWGFTLVAQAIRNTIRANYGAKFYTPPPPPPLKIPF